MSNTLLVVVFFFIFGLPAAGQSMRAWGKALLQSAVPRVEVNVPLSGTAKFGWRNHIYFFNTTNRYAIWLVEGRVVGIIQPQVGRSDLKTPIWWSGQNWSTSRPTSNVFMMCSAVSVKNEDDLRKKAKKNPRVESVGCEDPIHVGGTTWMSDPTWYHQADTVFIEEQNGQYYLSRKSF